MDGEAPMRFFLDETSFELPAGIAPESLEGWIEALVQVLGARHIAGDDVYRWSKLAEEIEVVPGKLLCDLLYQQPELSGFTIDRDARVALQQALNRCVDWDDRVEPAPEPFVEIDGEAQLAPTVAVVHSLVVASRGACCLALGARASRTGPRRVRVREVEAEVHFVTHDDQVCLFFRSLFEVEDLGADAYMSNAPRAFPALVFAPGLASQFGRFETPYAEVRPHVTKHLSVLNDHFQKVHRERKDRTDDAIGEFGIDASLELGKTHRNKDAMRQRTVVIGGTPVVCEWHTKIKRHTDRIHFHPGDPKVMGGRLVVGLFKDHFDT